MTIVEVHLPEEFKNFEIIEREDCIIINSNHRKEQ